MTWYEAVGRPSAGSGPKLFPDSAAPVRLALTQSEAYDTGVLHLAYTVDHHHH